MKKKKNNKSSFVKELAGDIKRMTDYVLDIFKFIDYKKLWEILTNDPSFIVAIYAFSVFLLLLSWAVVITIGIDSDGLCCISSFLTIGLPSLLLRYIKYRADLEKIDDDQLRHNLDYYREDNEEGEDVDLVESIAGLYD